MPKDSIKITPFDQASGTYDAWRSDLRDELIEAGHVVLFETPDPNKRNRFNGTVQCMQTGHPLYGTTPPKERKRDHKALCAKWTSHSLEAASSIRKALDLNTKTSARLLPDQNDHAALIDHLDRTLGVKDAASTKKLIKMFQGYSMTDSTIFGHEQTFLKLLKELEEDAVPKQPQTFQMVSNIWLDSLPSKFETHKQAQFATPSTTRVDLFAATQSFAKNNDIFQQSGENSTTQVALYANSKGFVMRPCDFCQNTNHFSTECTGKGSLLHGLLEGNTQQMYKQRLTAYREAQKNGQQYKPQKT